MTVKIKVTGNVFGLFGLMMWMGQEKWIDEKQAELMVEAGVAEIIERAEQVKPIKGQGAKPTSKR